MDDEHYFVWYTPERVKRDVDEATKEWLYDEILRLLVQREEPTEEEMAAVLAYIEEDDDDDDPRLLLDQIRAMKFDEGEMREIVDRHAGPAACLKPEESAPADEDVVAEAMKSLQARDEEMAVLGAEFDQLHEQMIEEAIPGLKMVAWPECYMPAQIPKHVMRDMMDDLARIARKLDTLDL